MKYKRLTPDELQALEQDFIHFLAAMQVTGPDWQKMKAQEPSKAEELIDVFSDVVYDKVLGRISYLEYRDAKTLNVFHCLPDRIRLVGLRVQEHSPLDLTAGDVLAQWNEHQNNGGVTVVHSEKGYREDKQTEVFELLQSGCYITDDRLFKALSAMV